jgi:hypothetical protein
MSTDYKYGLDGMSFEVMLEKMTRGWMSSETPCGSGSEIRNTQNIRSLLPEICRDYGIRSVNDAGAGDMRWIRLVGWAVDYRPFDLVPRRPEVTRLDITSEVMPKADLILCRHVLNHLSIRLAQKAIENFKASGSTYLLMTNNNNQRRYWSEFDFNVGSPLASWHDTQSWDVELYEL